MVKSKSIIYLQTNQTKLLKSLLCFLSYAGMGSVFTLLGSCLLDYQILVGEKFTIVAYLVQERAIGYVFGSLLAGTVINYFNKIFTLSLTNLVIGISIIISPWLSSFILLSFATVIGGIALGFLEIYCNVYIAHLWGGQSTNYLQALHMFFDLGALTAPLISGPFLLPMDPEDYNNAQEQSKLTNTTTEYTKDDLLIQYPHLIFGIFLIIISIVFAILWFSETDQQLDDHQEQSTETKDELDSWKRYLAIGLTALIINFEFGGQNLVSSLGPAFAVKSDLHMNKQDAAMLVTVYWSVCTIYRLFLIPMAIYWNEKKLIMFNVLIMITGASVMVSGADSNLTLAWISFSLLSMGFAPCFAFSFGLVQKYFSISSRLASLIFLAGTLGESIHPWIVANYLESSSSFYTIYFASIAYINSILCTVLVILIVSTFKRSQNYEPI
ncbi:sodium-dependent glucose transporter 1-like [Panonychus citri]|uniref:sodium-dependent glucose transporter 1-like n=1 Tax=Panonychus citri TaxID=50023 RepID=UPI002307F8CA|nr:sodium-dependent glucose transporter 1-like [Panonychus citri]